MLFSMLQEKYMQHQQAMRGWAGHPWTVNTPCLVWGHCDWPGMCEQGRAGARHGRSPICWAVPSNFPLHCIQWEQEWQIQRGVTLKTGGGLEKSINMWEPLGTTETWLILMETGWFSKLFCAHPGGKEPWSTAWQTEWVVGYIPS